MLKAKPAQEFSRRRLPGCVSSMSARSRAVAEAVERRAYLTASFADAASFVVGLDPIAVAVADVNNDKVSDVVTANNGSSTVSVLIGDGAGGLTSPADYPLAAAPTAVALGDVNGDGLADVVTGLADGTVGVMPNLGDGTFAAATYTTATTTTINDLVVIDMTGDGKVDIVTIAAGPDVLVVLGGNGDGTFTATGPAVVLAGGPSAVGVVDANGDTVPDVLVTSMAGEVSVLLRDATGAVTNVDTYATATTPYAVRARDMNGDGLADLVVAGTSAVSVLLNKGDGTFTDHVDFAVIGSAGGLVVEDVDRDAIADVLVVDTTADDVYVLHGDGAGALGAPLGFTTTGDARAVGLGDFNGDALPDLAVTGAAGDVVAVSVNTTTLPPPEEPPPPPPPPVPTDAPDLTPTIARITLPPVFTPGDRATVVVSIANVGVLPAVGFATVRLFASTDTLLDDADILLDTGAAMTDKAINLAPGRSKTLRGTFTATEALPTGTIYLLASVTPTNIPESITTNNTAVSATPFESTSAFGQLTGQRGAVRQIRGDEDGSKIYFTLSGPGTGTVTRDADGGIDVVLDGTTPSSHFTVTVRGGDGVTMFDDLTVNGSVAALSLPKVNLTGDITVAGDVRSLAALDMTGGLIALAGTTPTAVKLAALSDTNLTASAGVRSLVVAQWTGTGTITAAYVTTLKSSGDFSAAMSLSSGAAGPGGYAIKTASIGGSLGAVGWQLAGGLASLVVRGSVDTGFVANVTGTVSTLKVLGDFNGLVAAAGVNTVAVSGNVNGGAVLAGTNIGADGLSGTGDDTHAAGAIRAISVRGSTTNARFHAGVAPGATDPAVLALLPGGSIRSVVVRGGSDGASRFLAETLPRTARLGTEMVITATDSRFQP
jgi:hypothetical protein